MPLWMTIRGLRQRVMIHQPRKSPRYQLTRNLHPKPLTPSPKPKSQLLTPIPQELRTHLIEALEEQLILMSLGMSGMGQKQVAVQRS